MQFQKIKSELIAVCRRLHEKNMLASADGNVSVRLENGEVLITPTGVSKSQLTPEDFARITLDNVILEGNPSGERLMHLEVFKKCPKAKAVVHAHPPTAVAWSVAHPDLKELPSRSLSEVILAVGSIPFVPYARPGTLDMGTLLHPFLPQNRVMILSRHGALSWGESLDEAYNGMERLEHSAWILYLAKSMGGLTELPESEIVELRKLRKELEIKYGGKTL
jgi:L-fuculose-phosphate aldolase